MKLQLTIVLTTTLLLFGCALPTSKITNQDLSSWNASNLSALFRRQEPIKGVITVNEAIARALKYNLQRRVALLEEELALSEAGVAIYDLFPSAVIGARAAGRSNPPASDSKDIDSGDITPGNSYSSSIYPFKVDIDGQVAWNLLDFGVSIVRAHQATDRARIAAERRRKAVQEIVNEVQIAFWQAAASQRLSGDVANLLPRVDEAISLRKREETSGARPPLESLAEQRTLLELKRQLLAIHNTLTNSKVTLANLIGFRPGNDFRLNVTEGAGITNLNIGIEALERFGLSNRPELVEEAYSERIAGNDVTAAILSMLPSLSAEAGYNYTTDSLAVNATWANYGAQLTYNLLNLARGIGSIQAAKTRENLIKQRRLAVAMSVLTQVRLSWLNYWQAREQYQAAVDFSNIENRILKRVQDLARAGSVGELELIRAFMNALIGELNKDLSFADMRSALNRVLISIGTDPTPDVISSNDVNTVAAELGRHRDNWQQNLLAQLFVQDSRLAQARVLNLNPHKMVADEANQARNIMLSTNRMSPEVAELIKPVEGVFAWQFHTPTPSPDAHKAEEAPVSKVIGVPMHLISSYDSATDSSVLSQTSKN